jgi:asparagine synthase (glutamine-hydrolysing)
MCGILGIIKFTGAPISSHEIEYLNQAIYHRGPDDQGIFIEGNIGLAMRRLSIIDLDSGKQPIFTPDGNLLIFFNGEIYNYLDIKRELINLGYQFSTTSDTEVVLAAYQQWGVEAFKSLNGMWGLAILDKRKKELILSRDRLGKKQIYYILNHKYLVFGSEMKIPLLYNHGENHQLRLSTLAEYLTYGYISGEDTAVIGIKLLPEASYAKIDITNGDINIQKYWDINLYPNNPRTHYHSEQEAAEEVYSLLTDAVRLRLIASDVPVSVMLSSGLDSSTCAYILAKELNAPLKTFSLGYVDKDFDESEDAGYLAQRLDMPWQQLLINGTDIVNAYPSFINHIDSLQSNTAQFVYYFVNQMIHDAGFKVTINGNGGDELFAGYPTYRADTLFKIHRLLPSWTKKISHRLAMFLPPTLGRVSTEYALKKFTECPYRSPLKAHAYWRTMFTENELHALLAPFVWEHVPSFTRIYDVAYQEIGSGASTINGTLCADLKSWLIPMLPWTDNMSMAHSVEMRLPFLDYRLVEWSLNLAPEFLFRGWKLKRIMKLFLRGRLPKEVLYRKKRGTHLPISRWINHELKSIVSYYLDEAVINQDSLFNMSIIKQMIHEHQTKKADHTFKLWNLIFFSAWKERYKISL